MFNDKLWHSIALRIFDYKTPKLRKHLESKSYTIRFRHKFMQISEFHDWVEPFMYNKHKAIFLPITVNYIFQFIENHLVNETYLRMMQIPLILYRKKVRAAFDDRFKFLQY